MKYLVKGVSADREQRGDLQAELYDNLPGATSVVTLPVVQGLSVELEIADIAPFSRDSFEPYIAEHVLPEAVAIRCEDGSMAQIQLLKARFS